MPTIETIVPGFPVNLDPSTSRQRQGDADG